MFKRRENGIKIEAKVKGGNSNNLQSVYFQIIGIYPVEQSF